MEGEVAGDFFDVIDLGDGRVAVVVGDAPGHGPPAAELADELRAGIRRSFRLTDDPVEVFARMDQLLASGPRVQIATAACVIIDASSRELRIVNAGHPPAVLAGGDGVRLLDGQADPLLGVPAQRRIRRLALPVGANVLLYTDGLVERRGTSLDESLRGLIDLCAQLWLPSASAVDLARRALERFGVPADDATVLSVRVDADSTRRDRVVLRVYIDARDLRSLQTEAVVHQLARRLSGHLAVEVEVVDVSDPRIDTSEHGVLATPTVVRIQPAPRVRVIGALTSVADLARDLHLPLPPEDG